MTKPSSTRITAGVCTQQLPQTSEEKREERRKSLVRRRLEHELIGKLDKLGIDNLRTDCWFLVDAQWISRWIAFTQPGLDAAKDEKELLEIVATTCTTTKGDDENSEELLPPPPGPVSSARLLDKDVAPVSGPVPLPNLKPVVDYRGVPSMVYFAFVELHGKDKSPEIARYAVDIYLPAVPIERLMPIRYRAQTATSILVNKIRPKWVTWERHYSDDEHEIDDNGRHPVCCCGLTREHVEALIYWAVLCCTRASRKSSGRKSVSYRSYKPLKYRDGDSQHGVSPPESQERSNEDQQTVSSDTTLGADDDDEDSAYSDDDCGAVEEHGKNYRPAFLLRHW